MKKLKYITGTGALMLLTIFASVSCTDGNDWVVDSSNERLFSVTSSSLGISPEATTAEIKWTKIPGAEYYIIEASKDTLYNGAPVNSANGIVFGEDKSIVKSPFVLTDLDSDSKYFIRIKAMSSVKTESKWCYPEKFSFKTKPEQIMNTVNNQDKTSNSVRLSWTAGERVTKIELLKGGAIVQEKTLTGEEIAAGEIIFTGLEGGTSYQANLYNNDVRRGYALFITFPDAPDADVVLYLDATDIIDQAYLDNLATEHPGQSVTLALASDATYAVEEKLTVPDNMSINFFGIPGNNKTVLSIKGNVDYAGNHGFITFQNLNIDCLGKGYVMNQTNAGNVDKIEFNDCIIQNVATSFFRMQNASNIKIVNLLVINNCIIRNVGSGYYFIHIDAGSGVGVLKNLTIKDSTFDRICISGGKGFIYSNKTNMESIAISNCTMYKVASGGNRFIDFNTGCGATAFTVSNTVLGMTGDATVGGVRSTVAPSINNTYTTNDWSQTGDKVTYSTYGGTAADLFEDPENGNFSFKDGSFDSSIGDPRWIK
ncbi:MAG: DUF5123 domain-containing protein [Prevotella sp.]|jgi:hypothetical protein|nr:DUF5123 domain-containing protein [Prevotella sp.]